MLKTSLAGAKNRLESGRRPNLVLVDTSVWILFLRDIAPYATELSQLLLANRVVGHDLVYGELLIGDIGGRASLLKDFALMQQSQTVPHLEVVDFVRHQKLHGRGAGWIDIHLLASAVAGGHQFWTADPRLNELAKRFGVAYQIR